MTKQTVQAALAGVKIGLITNLPEGVPDAVLRPIRMAVDLSRRFDEVGVFSVGSTNGSGSSKFARLAFDRVPLGEVHLFKELSIGHNNVAIANITMELVIVSNLPSVTYTHDLIRTEVRNNGQLSLFGRIISATPVGTFDAVNGRLPPIFVYPGQQLVFQTEQTDTNNRIENLKTLFARGIRVILDGPTQLPEDIGTELTGTFS